VIGIDKVERQLIEIPSIKIRVNPASMADIVILE
jgi:hypothetical protein